MKRNIIFFLILILTFNIPFIYSATDEGYGEANDNLGQFTDTFENSNNLTVLVDVIVNTTLDCVELNYTGGSPIYENFTVYTEVDVGADRVEVNNDTYVEHLALRNEDTYLYYDYGANYFDDFTHDFDFSCAYDVAGSLGNPWTLSDKSIDDVRGLFGTANEKTLNCRLYRHTFQGNSISIAYYSGGGVTGDSDGVYGAISSGVLYFVRIVKNGAGLVLGVYSTSALRDAGDGTDGDITNLSLNMGSDLKFRYIYAVNTWNDGAGAYNCNYDVYRYRIGRVGGGYDTEGYCITEDYLNYTTGNSLTLLTNTSMPDGTSMTIQFSNDNITWTLNDWEPIFGGFEAVDLRILNYSDLYIMYNLSGTALLTPRLYQSRLVTTNGTAGGGTTIVSTGINSSGIIIVIFLCSIGVILIYGVKRKR